MTALTPSGPQVAVKYRLVGPDGTVATFNDSTDPNFVGYITEITGLDSPEVRENAENIAGMDGGIHGNFLYGRRPITIAGSIINIVSAEERNQRLTKLLQATNAMRADATLFWTPAGGEEQKLNLRRQQPVRVTGGWAKEFQAAMVSADPRIYSASGANGSVVSSTVRTVGASTKVLDLSGGPVKESIYGLSENNNNVWLFERNTANGQLTAGESKAAGTTPTRVLQTEDGKSVYVTNKGSNTISHFKRTAVTGVLAAQVTKATGEEPMGIAMSASSGGWQKVIYVANFKGNTISVFDRAETGELTIKQTFALAAGDGPSDLVCRFGKIFVLNKTKGTVKCLSTESDGKIKENIGTFTPSSMGTLEDIDVGLPETVGSESFWPVVLACEKGICAVAFKVGVVYTPSKGNYIVASGEKFKRCVVPNNALKNAYFTCSSNNKVVATSFSSSLVILPLGGGAEVQTEIATVGASQEVPAVAQGICYSGENVYTSSQTTNNVVAQYVRNSNGGLTPYTTALLTCINKGSMETFPIVNVTIPAGVSIGNFTLTNSSTGQSIVFNKLAVEGPQALTFNFKERTVVNEAGVSQFGGIELPATDWWALQPGENFVVLAAVPTGGTITAEVTWNHAWI